MAQAWQVLTMLIPNGGYVLRGDTYENIEFIECEPITKQQFEDGFAAYDSWKTQEAEAKATAKAALLERLGITADEAALLLGGN
jgi:hypothetical protein